MKINPGEMSKEIMAFAIIGLFMFAYAKNTSDEMMKTALVAALSTVLGYYMGGSKDRKPPETQDVNVVNGSEDPVPVDPKTE